MRLVLWLSSFVILSSGAARSHRLRIDVSKRKGETECTLCMEILKDKTRFWTNKLIQLEERLDQNCNKRDFEVKAINDLRTGNVKNTKKSTVKINDSETHIKSLNSASLQNELKPEDVEERRDLFTQRIKFLTLHYEQNVSELETDREANCTRRIEMSEKRIEDQMKITCDKELADKETRHEHTIKESENGTKIDIEESKKKISGLTKHIENIEKALNSLQTEKGVCDTNLKLRQNELKKTKEKYNKTDNILVELKKNEVEIDDLKNQIKAMSHELSNGKNNIETDLDIDRSRCNVTNVLEENSPLKNDMANSIALIYSLVANVTKCTPCYLNNSTKDFEKLESMRIIISELNNDVMNKTNIITDLNKKHETMRNNLSDLENVVKNKTHIITDINEKHEKMRNNLSCLENDVKIKTQIITDINEKHETMRNYLSDLENDVTNKTNIITDMNEKHEIMRINVCDLENDVKNKTQIIADINEKHETMRIYLSDLKNDVKNKTIIITDLNEKHETMRINLSVLKNDVNNKTNIITDLNEKHETMRINLSDLENDVKHKTHIITDLSNRCKKLDLEVKKWHNEYLKMKSEKFEMLEW